MGPPPPTDPIRIVCVSDLHGTALPKLPTGDILIVAGGLSKNGLPAQLRERLNELSALALTSFEHVIVIAGASDRALSSACDLYDTERFCDLPERMAIRDAFRRGCGGGIIRGRGGGRNGRGEGSGNGSGGGSGGSAASRGVGNGGSKSGSGVGGSGGAGGGGQGGSNKGRRGTSVSGGGKSGSSTSGVSGGGGVTRGIRKDNGASGGGGDNGEGGAGGFGNGGGRGKEVGKGGEGSSGSGGDKSGIASGGGGGKVFGKLNGGSGGNGGGKSSSVTSGSDNDRGVGDKGSGGSGERGGKSGGGGGGGGDGGGRVGRVVYLDHEGCVVAVGGRALRVWGSPDSQTPENPHAAFAVADDEKARELWSQVPAGVDVLVTHGPPRGYLDGGAAAGSAELARTLWRVRPALHVFGHPDGTETATTTTTAAAVVARYDAVQRAYEDNVDEMVRDICCLRCAIDEEAGGSWRCAPMPAVEGVPLPEPMTLPAATANAPAVPEGVAATGLATVLVNVARQPVVILV